MYCMNCGSPLAPTDDQCPRCATPRPTSGPGADRGAGNPGSGGQAGPSVVAPSSSPWVPAGGSPAAAPAGQGPPTPFPPAPDQYGPTPFPPAPPSGGHQAQPPGQYPPAPPPWSTDPGGGRAPKRGKGRLGALVVVAGLVAATVVGVLVVGGLRGSSGGAKNPQAAVEDLAEAVDAEDAVAAIATLDPGEVRTLGDFYQDAETKADALGLTGKGRTFGGVDLRLDGLGYDVDELSDDVAKVTITDGRLRYEITADELGETIQGAAGPDQLEDTKGTVDQEELRYQREDSGKERDPFIMVVKRDGGWYVSPFFTLAEYIVDIGGFAEGDFDADRDPTSEAKTPEDAVRDLATAIEEIDPDGVIDVLASDADVLRAYRDAINDGLESTVTDCQGGDDCDLADLAITVDDLELETEELSDDRAKVTIAGITGSVSYTDSDGDAVDQQFDYDGTCLEITGDEATEEPACLEDDAERFGIDRVFLIAVKNDGAWAVSPTDTMLEYGRLLVEALDERLVRRIAGTQADVEDALEVEVGETFDAELNDAGWATYRVELAEGDTITVEVDDSDLDDDADASLYDPDGEGTSIYESFTATTDGTHVLVVERGDFAEATVPVTITEVSEEEIELGTPVQSSIDEPGQIREFTFDGSSGDSVFVSIDDPTFTAELIDPSGQTLYADDGSTYELLDDGTFRVRVSSYGGETGSFTLLVEPPAPFTVDGEVITSAEGSIVDGFDVEGYSIEVASGKQVTVVVTPEAAMDATLSVYDVDFELVGEIDVAGPGGAETYVIDGYEGTEWYVEVGTVADTPGSFEVTLRSE